MANQPPLAPKSVLGEGPGICGRFRRMDHRRTAGFSLIEITMAMGILVTALMVAMGMVMLSGKQQRESTEMTIARSYLQSRVAELRALLHKDVIDTDNRQERFEDTIKFVDPAWIAGNTTATYTDTNLTLYDRGPKAEYEIVAYVSENAAAADFESVSGIDMDADGTPDEGGAQDTAEIRILPVRLTLKWLPASSTSKDPSARSEVVLEVLLY